MGTLYRFSLLLEISDTRQPLSHAELGKQGKRLWHRRFSLYIDFLSRASSLTPGKRSREHGCGIVGSACTLLSLSGRETFFVNSKVYKK